MCVLIVAKEGCSRILNNGDGIKFVSGNNTDKVMKQGNETTSSEARLSCGPSGQECA